MVFHDLELGHEPLLPSAVVHVYFQIGISIIYIERVLEYIHVQLFSYVQREFNMLWVERKSSFNLGGKHLVGVMSFANSSWCVIEGKNCSHRIMFLYFCIALQLDVEGYFVDIPLRTP